MGLAAGYECDEYLAKILPPGFCVAGHGVKSRQLLNNKTCKILILTYPTSDSAINLFNRAVHGRHIKIGKNYYVDLNLPGCVDDAELVTHDQLSFTITTRENTYFSAVFEYEGKLLVFINADITHNCRCIKNNVTQILKMIYEVYNYWDGKEKATLIDLANISEILKYIDVKTLLPSIDAVCNGIRLITGGKTIIAEKNLRFLISKYTCNDKEYNLDRELEFNSTITVKFEISNDKLRLVDVKSSSKKPITVGGQEDCHENINIENGDVCLGSYTNKIDRISLEEFGNNLCRILEYTFNVIQSALQKPNVCNSYQNCYSTKYYKGDDDEDVEE